MKSSETGGERPQLQGSSATSAGSRRLSRRQVICGAAATLAAVSIVPRHVLGGPGQQPPSEKLNVAGIGIGGVGRSFLRGCASQNMIALCDVDKQYAARVFQEYPDAKRYRDYREMFDKQPEIDAVVVATPDHSHAVISLHAIKLGKHVLCVKPLTRTIHEARTLAEAARKAKVATQVTASSRTSESALRLCEMIWDGAIGQVREAHCWSNRPLWPQGMDRPAGEDKVPDYLDWDLWIGPAPMRPFKNVWPEGHLALKQVGAGGNRGVYHPWNFRGWWDFGTGALGDMGCHHFNALFKALKLGHPTSVEASSTRVLPETAPLASVVTWEFPARGDMPPLRLTWSDGGIKPPRPSELEAGRPWPNEGNLYVGDKGKILGGTNDGRIIPDEKVKAYQLPPKTLPRPAFQGNLVTAEWIAACQGGQPASCNFDVAGLLTEVVLLGNIAIRTGKKLYWDAEKLKFTNDEDANKYIREPYRSGWSL
jgi:predicted dehydrogenase